MNLDEQSAALLHKLHQAIEQGNTCISVNEAEATTLLSTGLVGDAAAPLPFIVQDGLLSSQRYYRYEQDIAAHLQLAAKMN